MPSLRCLAWTFSTCGKWGLFSSCSTSVSHCGGFSRGAQALGHAGCISCSSWALIAPWHMESSWIRDGTHVPCSESSLNHWTTRKVPKMVNFYVMWISYQFFLMRYKEAQNKKEGTPCSWESLSIIPEKEKANAWKGRGIWGPKLAMRVTQPYCFISRHLVVWKFCRSLTVLV